MIRSVVDRSYLSMNFQRRNLRGAADQPMFDGVLRITGPVGQRWAVVEVFGGPSDASIDLYVDQRLMGSGNLDSLGQGTITTERWPDQLRGHVELRDGRRVVASGCPMVRRNDPPDGGGSPLAPS